MPEPKPWLLLTGSQKPVFMTSSRHDQPENPRDFDVEGSQGTLLNELMQDVKDYPEVISYTVDESEANLWQVWRHL